MAVRKYSRKREAILSCVRSTHSHPTAEWVYHQLKPALPDLSLGTVYRNLAMFKREGVICSVGIVDGMERFDSNVLPHAHFICTHCNGVYDLEGRRAASGTDASGHLRYCKPMLAHLYRSL